MCIGSGNSIPVVATGGAGQARGREYTNATPVGGSRQLTPEQRSRAMSVEGFKSTQAYDQQQLNDRLGVSDAVAKGTMSAADQAALDYRRPRNQASTNTALLTAGNKLLGTG